MERSKRIRANCNRIVERLGFSLDQIKIELASIDNNYQTTLDDDLRTVQEYMNHRPIRESMHNLAALLKVSEWARTKSSRDLIKQAEESALIQRAQRKKKSAKSAS